MRSTFGTFVQTQWGIGPYLAGGGDDTCYYVVKTMLDAVELYKVDRVSFEQVIRWIDLAKLSGFPIEG